MQAERPANAAVFRNTGRILGRDCFFIRNCGKIQERNRAVGGHIKLDDIVLLWILAVLLLVAAFMRIALADKKKQPLSLGWKIQAFLFPAAIIVSAVCLQTGRDYVFAVIMLGLLEELVCFFLRKKRNKSE